MAIELKEEVQQRLAGSIRKYFQENMDEEVGDLKAMLLMEFFLKELGPAVYNQGVSDAQGVMAERVSELDSICYASEDDFRKK